jgi:hypothetical protein
MRGGLSFGLGSPAIRSRGDTATGKKRELTGRPSNAVRQNRELLGVPIPRMADLPRGGPERDGAASTS